MVDSFLPIIAIYKLHNTVAIIGKDDYKQVSVSSAGPSQSIAVMREAIVCKDANSTYYVL